jgi:hypothetical protein
MGLLRLKEKLADLLLLLALLLSEAMMSLLVQLTV